MKIVAILSLLLLSACGRATTGSEPRTVATERVSLDRCNPYGMNYPELNGWLPCVNDE